MIPENMKEWIDNASYEQLLSKWRFEPTGSPWFTGDTGEYFEEVMNKKKAKLPSEEQVAASKRVGWVGAYEP